ncbi:MAG: VWA domain-containing protein [Myxococcales bacterium]|nr:VWA domain-containing protein [Myxococcales bacterium]
MRSILPSCAVGLTLSYICSLGCAAESGGSGGRRSANNTSGGAFGNSQATTTTGAAGTGSFSNTDAVAPTTGAPLASETMDLGDGEVCDADVYSGERTRLDIYMMVDDSGSMVPWWPGTLDAINMFFNDPGSEGIGVGVNFFGSDCNVATYATPRVAIAPLPGNTASLQAAFPLLPIEGTATEQAMEGAISHARTWQMQNPDSKTVVVLVTDGAPDDCGSTIQGVVNIAAEGFNGSPSIQTFVVGINFDTAPLDMFAAAGGTGKAIPTTAPADLVKALNDIRSAALPCDFKIPDNGATAVDPNRVNLRHTTLSGEQLTIGQVPDAASCDAVQGGWYYDNPAAPTRLMACDQSCNQLNVGGEVQVLLGCKTVTIVPD